MESSKLTLITQGAFTGVPIESLLGKWLKSGCFMHTPNHPKLHVLADVCRAVMAREKIGVLPDVELYLKDNLAVSACWPVYPEVAAKLGIQGHYHFKKPGEPVSMLGLEEFLQKSFAALSNYQKDDLTCSRLESDRYTSLADFLHGGMNGHARAGAAAPNGTSETLQPRSAQSKGTSPYEALPDYQFWRRAVERPLREEVDPVLRRRFQLRQEDKIATAGSCFAQHISRTLKANGCNYYVTETGASLSPEQSARRNFGVFSARYGNVYTARQLVQLFDRAYGRFIPDEPPWRREDGRYADPFRPQIEPDGFATPEHFESFRPSHLACVRCLFRTLDVLVFTLGLTESWISRSDGAVFPLAPGVVAGTMDPERHEFVNFETDQVIEDMQGFIDRLRGVNPKARMILTVSPVPLIATYENRHVLVSNTYSKSALRAAADALVRRNAMCDYFPSYEIITGNYTRGEYYEEDLRSVKQVGVDHVMRLFMRHYFSDESVPEDRSKLDQELAREAAIVGDIVCDEEALDQKRPVPAGAPI
jgi:hypothetical protein